MMSRCCRPSYLRNTYCHYLRSRKYSASKAIFSTIPPNLSETLKLRWIHKDGTETITPAAVGVDLMHTAHKHGIELEGACEGVCACSTCHVILEKHIYDNLPEASENEEDMLDQAFGLTATSRLGCQIKLVPEHDNMVIKLPKATRNFYVVSMKYSMMNMLNRSMFSSPV